MHFQKEADGSLRVELTHSDLARFDLCYESLHYNNPKTRPLFSALLCGAKETLGFSTAGEQLLIEAFPAPAQGCTLYFTALGPKRRRFKQKLPCVYVFSACDSLLDALAQLQQRKSSFEVYSLAQKYFLLAPHGMDRLLREYGDRQTVNRSLLAHIREHGRLLRKENGH